MVSSVNILSYQNIISTFFANNKLISQRKERIDNGLQFVLDNVPVRSLSQKLQDVVRNKVVGVEMTFIRKWKECKARSKEDFELHYDKWIHMDLKVRRLRIMARFFDLISVVNTKCLNVYALYSKAFLAGGI